MLCGTGEKSPLSTKKSPMIALAQKAMPATIEIFKATSLFIKTACAKKTKSTTRVLFEKSKINLMIFDDASHQKIHHLFWSLRVYRSGIPFLQFHPSDEQSYARSTFFEAHQLSSVILHGAYQSE